LLRSTSAQPLKVSKRILQEGITTLELLNQYALPAQRFRQSLER
jgi:hypothetical protein